MDDMSVSGNEPGGQGTPLAECLGLPFTNRIETPWPSGEQLPLVKVLCKKSLERPQLEAPKEGVPPS